VAPEHTDPEVLRLMRKPANRDFEWFANSFAKSPERRVRGNTWFPTFIASHPGSDLAAMIELAVFLSETVIIPTRFKISFRSDGRGQAMYYTGIDPFSKEPLPVARHLRDRKLQRALLQFFKPRTISRSGNRS